MNTSYKKELEFLKAQQYEYGKVKALQRTLQGSTEILYDAELDIISLPKFYNQKNDLPEGECSELAKDFLSKVTTEFPNRHFYFANALEKNYFFQGNHAIVVESKTEIIKKKSLVLTTAEIEPLREQLTIIDPSFNIIIPYKNKIDYNIQSLYHPQSAFLVDEEELLLIDMNSEYAGFLEHAIASQILGIDNNNLVSIHINSGEYEVNNQDINAKRLFRFTIGQPEKRPTTSYVINKKNLSQIQRKDIRESLEMLANMKMKETYYFE